MPREHTFFFKIIWWVSLVIIYTLAILPQDMAPTVGSLSDKSHHILAFLVLAILLKLAYLIKYWHAFFLLAAFGLLIEVSQLFAINRSGEVADVVADIVGIFIGLKLYTYTKKVIS
jgi:VanZ family protein